MPLGEALVYADRCRGEAADLLQRALVIEACSDKFYVHYATVRLDQKYVDNAAAPAERAIALAPNNHDAVNLMGRATERRIGAKCCLRAASLTCATRGCRAAGAQDHRHCGLPWPDRCLSFHVTDRPVRTASATQMSQPIYKRAVGRWRVYEKHLGRCSMRWMSNHQAGADVLPFRSSVLHSPPSRFFEVSIMAFSSWRGVVGMINPTMRPGVTEEVCRLLPEGIGLIPLFLNIRRGTEDEFHTMMPHYEKLVAVLAEEKCDLIHPHGAPPFMVLGRKGEDKIVKAWEKKYKVPVMSVAQNHVNALHALHAKSFVGATYFPDKLNTIFAKYFRDAGFTVRGMEGIDVPFNQVQTLSGEQVYAHIKKNFLKAKGADAIYMLGSGWRTLNIIAVLEQDLQVPVVHPVPARVWEIQKRLHVRQPMKGYGHLLESFP